MEMPDLKEQARKAVDDLNGSAVGVVQLLASDKGHVSVCIAGVPEVITHIIADALKSNPQIKALFEAAWCQSMPDSFNPSMN